MIKIEVELEDTRIYMVRGTTHWMVTIVDTMTMEAVTTTWTDNEAGATMALAIGGDEIVGANMLYPVAEQAYCNMVTTAKLNTEQARVLRVFP